MAIYLYLLQNWLPSYSEDGFIPTTDRAFLLKVTWTYTPSACLVQIEEGFFERSRTICQLFKRISC